MHSLHLTVHGERILFSNLSLSNLITAMHPTEDDGYTGTMQIPNHVHDPIAGPFKLSDCMFTFDLNQGTTTNENDNGTKVKKKTLTVCSSSGSKRQKCASRYEYFLNEFILTHIDLFISHSKIHHRI